MSSTTSAAPSATTSTQSLYPTRGPVSSSTSVLVPPSAKKKKPSDRIPATNCCASFFYNIPRSSVMITLPGFAILAIGAILIATFPKPWSPEWTDGLQLISLIFLILGGAWTLGGLIYWAGAWCRYRPKKPEAKLPQWTPPTGEVDSATPEQGLELVKVYRVDGESVMNSNQSLNTNGKVFTVS